MNIRGFFDLFIIYRECETFGIPELNVEEEVYLSSPKVLELNGKAISYYIILYLSSIILPSMQHAF
jgi:hypothetical protein